MSFSNHRSASIFCLRIGLGISLSALMLQSGCERTAGPASSNYDEPTSADAAAIDEYQPPPPEVLTAYETDLNPYGSWVAVSGYGQCWAPSNRPAGWEPYTVGYWADTDYGWSWVAVGDEAQWGDVTYHYGRWYNAPSAGWVWIPGTTWAPAWVAWREGGGYCGWAPLPPQAGFGVQFSAAVVDRYVPANQYVYCDERYVTSGRVDQHIVRNDVAIINKTANITNITYVNNHVVNQGMPASNVARATGHSVKRVSLSTAATPAEAHRLTAAGKPVMYAPPVVQHAEKQRVSKAKTPAVVQNRQIPAKADNGVAQTKEQRQINASPAPAVKAKGEREQTAAEPKEKHGDAAAPKAQESPKEAAPKAKDDHAAAEKAKAPAAKKPEHKPSDDK
ncbi:MAG TPA: DUF6600 domain-containing protein [Tepidisphaeraceae bacterium]|jgi:hypothetical protein|nr:DUF6600 domain-containing protein [Tepidisphaeraceae bacterium]